MPLKSNPGAILMIEVKSYIERLAATECPCRRREYLCLGCEGPDGPCCKACMCQDTGALVPGLRQKCKYCFGTGYTCSKREEKLGVGSSVCQGRGWVLIPEGEWMGVLIRFIHKVGWEFSYEVWEGTTTIFIWNAKTRYEIGEATGTAFDEETLTQAILEAMRIL
jgi:hypothetical protein